MMKSGRCRAHVLLTVVFLLGLCPERQMPPAGTLLLRLCWSLGRPALRMCPGDARPRATHPCGCSWAQAPPSHEHGAEPGPAHPRGILQVCNSFQQLPFKHDSQKTEK